MSDAATKGQSTRIGGWGVETQVTYKLAHEMFQTWWHFQRFVFHVEGGFERTNGQWNCWWPHGAITILGLTIGAGIYIGRGRTQ